jgi:hypothetical protein
VKAIGLTTQCDRNENKKAESKIHFNKRGETEKPFEYEQNFKNNKMKKLLILATMLLTFGFANAQKVYKTSYKSEADKIIFVTEYKSEADMIVYETKYKSEAKSYSGLWFWTESKSEADWKVYFTKNKSEANLKIYFTKNKSEAGMK